MPRPPPVQTRDPVPLFSHPKPQERYTRSVGIPPSNPIPKPTFSLPTARVNFRFAVCKLRSRAMQCSAELPHAADDSSFPVDTANQADGLASAGMHSYAVNKYATGLHMRAVLRYELEAAEKIHLTDSRRSGTFPQHVNSHRLGNMLFGSQTSWNFSETSIPTSHVGEMLPIAWSNSYMVTILDNANSFSLAGLNHLTHKGPTSLGPNHRSHFFVIIPDPETTSTRSYRALQEPDLFDSTQMTVPR